MNTQEQRSPEKALKQVLKFCNRRQLLPDEKQLEELLVKVHENWEDGKKASAATMRALLDLKEQTGQAYGILSSCYNTGDLNLILEPLGYRASKCQGYAFILRIPEKSRASVRELHKWRQMIRSRMASFSRAAVPVGKRGGRRKPYPVTAGKKGAPVCTPVIHPVTKEPMQLYTDGRGYLGRTESGKTMSL